MLRQHGPWYRAGVRRSYVPASIFLSVGYAICLGFFSVFFILSGGIMTGISRQEPDPIFDKPFFREHRSKGGDVIGIIGPAFLGIGCILLLISITLCMVVFFLAKKQENKRHKRQEQSDQPLHSDLIQPPPTSAYPHQPPPTSAYPHQPPPPQSFPPPSGYPAQPVDQFSTGSGYPPQYPPPQPAGYYPPQPPPEYSSSNFPPATAPQSYPAVQEPAKEPL